MLIHVQALTALNWTVLSNRRGRVMLSPESNLDFRRIHQGIQGGEAGRRSAAAAGPPPNSPTAIAWSR